MIDMAGKQIIPAVIRYTANLAESLTAVQTACPEADTSVQKELLLEASDLLSDMKTALARLTEETEKAAKVEGNKERAYAYHDIVTAAMEELRRPADKLEMIQIRMQPGYVYETRF